MAAEVALRSEAGLSGSAKADSVLFLPPPATGDRPSSVRRSGHGCCALSRTPLPPGCASNAPAGPPLASDRPFDCGPPEPPQGRQGEGISRQRRGEGSPCSAFPSRLLSGMEPDGEDLGARGAGSRTGDAQECGGDAQLLLRALEALQSTPDCMQSFFHGKQCCHTIA